MSHSFSKWLDGVCHFPLCEKLICNSEESAKKLSKMVTRSFLAIFLIFSKRFFRSNKNCLPNLLTNKLMFWLFFAKELLWYIFYCRMMRMMTWIMNKGGERGLLNGLGDIWLPISRVTLSIIPKTLMESIDLKKTMKEHLVRKNDLHCISYHIQDKWIWHSG